MQYEFLQKLYKLAIEDLERQANQEYRRGRRKKAASLRKKAQDYYLIAGFMPGPSTLPMIKAAY